MRLIQRVCLEEGYQSGIFSSQNKSPKEWGILSSGSISNCDLLLIHHSHGNPDLENILNLPYRKILIYHNITPSHFFRHDPHLEKFSRMGRDQLSLFKGKCETTFAVSRYNLKELERVGLPTGGVFSLLDLEKPSLSAYGDNRSTNPQAFLYQTRPPLRPMYSIFR
jgi:hypothetical protein